jgi:translocation and assembly module TamB
MIRKFLVLLLLGSVLAVAYGVVFLVQTREGRGVLSELLQDRLEAETGLLFSIDDVAVDPWSAGMEVVGVRVAGVGAPPLFQIQRAHLDLAPLQLLGGAVVVDRVDLDRPRVKLVVRDGRILGLPVLDLSGGGGGGGGGDLRLFRLAIRQLRLTGMEVQVRVDGKHPLTAVLEGLRAQVDQRGHDTHDMAFTLGKGSFKLPSGQTATLRQLEGRATLQGDGLLRPEQMDITHAVMALDAITGTMRGTIRFAPLSTGLIPAADLVLAGTLPMAQLNAYFPDWYPMAGAVSVDVHVRSAFGAQNPTATGTGQLQDIRLNDFRLTCNTSGDFSATLEGVDFTNVRSDWANGDIRGQGRVEFGKEVTARFTAGGHGSFAQGMENIRVSGSWVDFGIAADVAFEGTLWPDLKFRGHGVTELTDFHWWSESYATAEPDDVVMRLAPIRGESDMEFTWKHFSFTRGTITDGRTAVTGMVYLPFGIDEDMVVEASADPAAGQVFDCQSLSPIGVVRLTCRGPGKATLRGPYSDVRLKVTADLTGVSVHDYQLGEARGRMEYDDLMLRFLDVKGRKGRTTWEGDASLSWRAAWGMGPDGRPLGRPRTKRDNMYLTVAARHAKGYAEDIRSVIPPGWGSVMEYVRTLPLHGPVEGWADARGAIGDGTVDDLTFETEFHMGAVDLYGQPFDRGHVSAHMDLRKFHFDDLTLSKGPSTWHARGTIAREDGGLAIDASIRDMPLAQLDALSGSTTTVAGTMDAVINARGAVSDWQGPVKLDVREVAYGDIPIGTGGLDLVMGGGRIKGDGPLFDGRARANLSVKLEPPWAYVLDLEAERGPAQDLVGHGVLPKGVTLTLQAKAHAEGTLSEAGKSRGTATLGKVAVGYRNLALRDDGGVKLRFRGGVVDVDRMVLVTDEGGRLDLKGEVSGDKLDLRAELASDLSLARSFMESVAEARGPATLVLGITGTPAEPVLVGQGAVTDGYVRVDGFRHAFKGINSNVSFVRDRIVLDPLSFSLDDSPVKGHADILLKGMSLDRISVTIRFQDLRFQVPEYVPTRLRGTLTMSGLPEDMTLSGDVDVLEARYTDPWDWERLSVELRRGRLAPKVYDKDKEWLSYDVNLRADDKIYVQNSTMNAEFRGNLHLTGTNERPGLVGTLTSLGGRATYRNNTFQLGRSTVDFVERNRIAVVVDVEATTHVKEYDIWVDVEGPVEQLSAEHGIRLRSRPDLPPVDVASLVLFGFTQNDLYRNQGAAPGGAVAVGGLDFLTSVTGVDKEVRRALPKQVIDELYLTSRTPRGVSAGGQGSVPAVVVGTEIWPGTRLRFTSTLLDAGGNQTEQSIELEKRWSEHLSGRLVWDRAAAMQAYGDAGGDVRYRWEF